MRWFWRIFFTLALLAGWVFLGYHFIQFTLGSAPRTEPVQVEIKKGMSLQQIGETLKQKRLLREAYFFRYYAIYRKMTSLKAGVYEIKPDEKLDDMLRKFTESRQDMVKVTIPEGENVLQIADRIQAAGFDRAGFLQALKERTPVYAFEKQIPQDNRRKYHLEGYLFPSTYQIRRDAKSAEIVEMMLHEFELNLKKINAYEEVQTIPYPNKKIDVVVVIASLIEREGKVRTELPTIAGVIYNRLNSKSNQKLMIDAVNIYIYSMRGEKITVLTNKEKYVDDPYNTYNIIGLPPGPISCPGEQALAAALHPQPHQYEFYVAREDGTGRHYFAVTNAEHEANKAKSEDNRKKYGNPPSP
jgi:UPF0755 protein